MTNTINTSQNYLDNAINIFTSATSDASSQLNLKFNTLENIYNTILSTIGGPIPTQIIIQTTTPVIISLNANLPIITNKPIIENFNYKLNMDPTSIYDYQQQISEINAMITVQYNLIVKYSNQVIGVINQMQELTKNITENLSVKVNNETIIELQHILQNYFPSSTNPPIPEFNLLIEYEYTPIPTQSVLN